MIAPRIRPSLAPLTRRWISKVSQTIHLKIEIHLRLKGGVGRINARSDRVVLELFGYFFFQEKK